MHLRTVSPMSSDPRVPKNGTVSNSPFHFLEIFRQLVADFFENSSYDVGRTMFDENFGLVCWRPEMKVGVHCANDKAPGNYARRKNPSDCTRPMAKSLRSAKTEWPDEPRDLSRRNGEWQEQPGQSQGNLCCEDKGFDPPHIGWFWMILWSSH